MGMLKRLLTCLIQTLPLNWEMFESGSRWLHTFWWKGIIILMLACLGYFIQLSTFSLYEVWIYVSLLDYTLLGPFWKETQCHVTTLDWRVEGALERSQSIWCFQKVEIQTLSRIFVVGPWLPNVRYFSSWSLHGKLTCSYCSSNTNCFCLAFGRNITSIVIDGCCPGNTTLEAIRKAS